MIFKINIFKVSIFGKCNNMLKEIMKSSYGSEASTLNIRNRTFNNSKFQRNSDGEKSVLDNNKFFLAFENNDCSDYITEKFWRSLSFDIIPVVIY